jgi:A/G-specific adenine glycosylase
MSVGIHNRSALNTPSSRAKVEGSRRQTFKVNSAGSLDIARDDGRRLRLSLLGWYRRHGRDLPWRRTEDPYAILVSEIMLQQTQATAVVPYYNRWLRRFPTLRSLARADQANVLHAWQGLGYYSRARNLHQCAKTISEERRGIFPHNPKELQSLPGIGRYTANAIAVFAFDRSLPLIEANTGRVIARLFDIRDPVDSIVGRRKLWEASSKLVPNKRARDFQNALMDLGSLICTVRNPRCPVCPVRKFCRARHPASLPRKRKRAAMVSLIESHRFCTVGDAVLLEQSRQRWHGMWILPPVKLDCLKQSSSTPRPIHTSVFPFTNHRITLQVYRQRAQRIDHPLQRWFHKHELGALPIPSPHRRALIDLLSTTPCHPERKRGIPMRHL